MSSFKGKKGRCKDSLLISPTRNNKIKMCFKEALDVTAIQKSRFLDA
jgi:hypothetical protein